MCNVGYRTLTVRSVKDSCLLYEPFLNRRREPLLRLGSSFDVISDTRSMAKRAFFSYRHRNRPDLAHASFRVSSTKYSLRFSRKLIA